MNLLVSFSGGKTSAYMSYLLKKQNEHNMVFVFANTGQENEETLEFVDRVDKEFNLGVVWVEAVIFRNRRGTEHRVVDYKTSCRDGSLFEDMIKKYGIPNTSWPHCTRELKQRPIHSFVKSLGWKSYKTAIGIRSDEMRRAKDNGFHPVYPLIDWWETDKQDVNTFWESQPFNLNLKEYQGNCKWCWKKSDKKHIRIIKESPSFYDVPEYLEGVYGKTGAEFKRDPSSKARVFFRKNRSTAMMRKLAEISEMPVFYDDEDSDSGCSESCEFI